MKTLLFTSCSGLIGKAIGDIQLQRDVEGSDLGRVTLVYGRHVAVFPNLHEARRAADAALHPEVGGFNTVAL